jgi:hypothetical protein
VRIEVLDCVIDGKGKGEQLEVNREQGEYLIKIGYAKEVKEAPKKEAEKPAPKRSTRKTEK